MSLDNGNNKTTIIISAYNRPNRLKRILDYYNKYGNNFKIIVADSSLNENKKLNNNIISSFSDINILCLEYPEDINSFYYAKNADALNYVNTKYTVFCADDDFIIPNGISQSVDFLETNLDFSCAQGHYISFCLKNEDKREVKIRWNFSPYLDRSITFPEAESRLASHLSNYQLDTFYAVHRTDLLKMVFKDTVKFTDDVRFGELLPSMLDSVYGKIKELDYLYCARETISDSSSRTSKYLRDFMKEGTYKNKYINFKNCLTKHLIKNSQLSIDESKKVIDKAMSAYLKKYHTKSFKGILIGKMINLLNALDLPGSIDKNIRMLYKMIFTPRYVLNRSKEIDDFKNTIESQDSKYFDDVERIRKHVLLYAKNNNKNIKDTICN